MKNDDQFIYVTKQLDDMDKLLIKLLWEKCRGIKMFTSNSFNLATVITKIGIIDLYKKWVDETFAIFTRSGYLSFDGETYTVTKNTSIEDTSAWKEWEHRREAWLKDDNLKSQVVLVETMLGALPDILTGKQPATDIMFPQSSMSLVEGVYKHNLLADYFNDALAEKIVVFMQERGIQSSVTSKPIRILEIGAGTGGTSASVLPRLKPYQEYIEEYCYTDLSLAFLRHGEKEYGPEYPFVTFKIFNIEQPVATQDIDPNGYDLVIATNVVHATKNIRHTLRNVKAAMKNNGLLLLNEIADRSVFTHLTFGFLQGWWMYEDTALRIPGCPGLYPDSWKKVLKSEGFHSIDFPVAEQNEYKQQIICAKSDGVSIQLQDFGPVTAMADNKKDERKTLYTHKEHQQKQSEWESPKDKLEHMNITDQMIEEHLIQIIRESISEELKINEAMIHNDQSFSEYGVDSIIGIQLIQRINNRCHTRLQTTVVFDYNNVNQLVHYMITEYRPTLGALLDTQEPLDVSSSIKENKEGDMQNSQRTVTATSEKRIEKSDFIKASMNHPNEHSTLMRERSKFHRVLIKSPGGIDDIQIVESDILELKEDEVRISIRAFSLNFGDLLCLQGLYPTMPPYPFTPGFEASGVVVEVGSAVSTIRLGDEVVYCGGEHLAGQASLLTCKAAYVFPKPASLSFEEACSLPVVSMTVIAAFRRAQVKKGEKILIQTATGGVGLIAVQLAKHYGAEIYATASSEHKLEYVKQMGVSHAINYIESDFEQEIYRLTNGQGVDIVINTLAGDAIQKGLGCLAIGGRYIEIAMTALKSARAIDLSILSNNQSFISLDLRKLMLEQPNALRDYRNEMLRLVKDNVIQPTIYKVFSFDEIKEAYQCMKNRENIGKIVVQLPKQYQYIPALAIQREPIAIIGMSGRFAKSKTVDELWEHLSKGRDLVEEVSRWDLSQYYDESASYCNQGSFVDRIDQFDPLFFNISGVEAMYMDPQQRIFLEESWKALEDAGYAGAGVQGKKCGVYVGCSGKDYQNLFDTKPPATSFWGNAASIIPARIAYYLDLQGPAIAVDTACSSSLVAIHLACQSLWTKETEMALAGGVFLQSTPAFYLESNRAGMLSPAGRCHTFDERADGFVPGEGAGVIILKRLSDAIADRDHIYGVIRGSGVNQDGSTNGITAPSAKSQERLEQEVYDTFNLQPRHIQMIEAHGTGTKLGDPIEFQALTRAFTKYTDEKNYCAIGSIKSNLGHLAFAAGVTGIIKILLSLQHKQIPPTLHFQKGNPNIEFEDSPFYVNTSLTEWTAEPNKKRCAAISSFGFSGTNAHMVIEEAPSRQLTPSSKPGYLLTLSARTQDQLKQQVEQIVQYCEKAEQVHYGNMSYTLLLGRKHFNHRLAFVVHKRNELVDVLKRWLEKGKAPDVYTSIVNKNEQREQIALKRYGNECLRNINGDMAANEYIEQLSILASLYTQGYELDFEHLFEEDHFARIPLPTYPFAKEFYWVPERDEDSIGHDNKASQEPSNELPSLLPSHTSEVQEEVIQSDKLSAIDEEAIMVAPVWEPLCFGKQQMIPALHENLVIVGGTETIWNEIGKQYPHARVLSIHHDDSVEEMVQKLSQLNPIDHMLWIAPAEQLPSLTDDSIIEGQEKGVIYLFKIIKSLLALGYDSREIGWTVITQKAQPLHKYDEVNPTHASIHGLMGTLAKEYSHWKIRVIDLEFLAIWPMQELFTLPSDADGNPYVYREQQWHQQELVPVRYNKQEETLYKTGGVYVVIGGAGGIGEVWSEYVIRMYEAKVIWIGRREKDANIQAKIDRLASIGPAPSYFVADATDQEELYRAYEEIKQQYGSIHGIVHSAIVLLDKSLANMEEERFRGGLRVKVDVSVNIAAVFQDEPLDFVLFFSSMNSFVKAAGQSNYVAGCTFKDAFASQLALEWPCAVKVMNWGYWGTVGTVASEEYQRRMKSRGVGSIEPPEAMSALEALLVGPMNQLAFAKMTTSSTWINVNKGHSFVLV
ncbi:SDR family NAD(P)-dependent oxidoreductase [Brevibacillus laterosporus]|uniref:SDR family NAD(P)-dependent oxidoreductase n=1 Tax=Brevibacillus laterosporus TaxID=1465 RepID=UPI00264D8C1D|nr:SDR family NAD(P)-dependent oxidoreductase [Brevibacillus laterosporus]MDN9009024.1 SDR family NAD(P)-dependent oxidoreductase [Brevibacillus laterosporus]MDO0942477.1 SDR family NAD(P)-dependent oxidoreductase [Brevibacillus laterosporus]